jgi:heat shock protein HtpX
VNETDPVTHVELIAKNRRTSMLMLGIEFLLVGILGAAIGILVSRSVPLGILIGAAVAIVVDVIAWSLAVRATIALTHAVEVTPEQAKVLHNVIEGLCLRTGMPKPRVYIVDDPAPNAFSTGRNPKHAAIAVTTGLLERMNRVELEGVLAHELSHIRNYDVLVMTLAVTMVGIIALLSDFFLRIMFWTGGRGGRDDDSGNNPLGIVFAILGFVLLIFAPIIAALMQMAVSRRREYLADASGVLLTRYPPGLISALGKLKDDHTSTHFASKATAHLWIEEPLDKESNRGDTRWNHLFDTHPPIDDRIRALEQM